MEEIGGLGIPLRSLWPTLHCRRVAGVSPLLSIGWCYLSSVSPKRHCYRKRSLLNKVLLAKSFISSPVTISPHKTLDSSRGVISEPDLLNTPEAEILEGFSNQGVIQVSIRIKKDTTVIPTKHLILTFSSPTLPHTIKAGYLNCKISPYVLRCWECQRFGHSQTSCHGQLIYSRCASVGHASTDCSLETNVLAAL
ncbi:putative RNA-directed DNA polymerase from transposon BS [Trichonephila clavipes]|nr:putative RNA-directed DNA polymerase from transposon BS [Trichonephila clavipes]